MDQVLVGPPERRGLTEHAGENSRSKQSRVRCRQSSQTESAENQVPVVTIVTQGPQYELFTNKPCEVVIAERLLPTVDASAWER